MARELHKVWLFGDTYTIHVTGKDTAGEYAVLEVSSPPGNGPPLHRHTREVEGYYIMNGEFMFQNGDTKLKAEPGTFVHLEKHTPHSFKSVGNDTGKMLTTIIPAGFENFFIETGKPISDDSFSPPLENIDIREIIKLLKEKYDIETLA